MTPAWLTACALVALQGKVRLVDDGWVATWEATFAHAEGCDGVRLVERPGERLRAATVTVVRAAGTRERLDLLAPADIDPRRADGMLPGPLAVHDLRLVQLAPGDQLRVRLDIAAPAPDDLVLPVEGTPTLRLRAPAGALAEDDALRPSRARGRRWLGVVDAPTALRLRHPWAGDVAASPGLPVLPTRPLPDAVASLDALTFVPRGLDGYGVVAGEPALARGAVDDRGYARTLAATVGPDAVVVRWSPAAEAPPAPDAPEAVFAEGAVWRHPHDPVAGGVYHTPAGPQAAPVEAIAAPAEAPAPTWSAELTLAVPGRARADATADPRAALAASKAVLDGRLTARFEAADRAHYLVVAGEEHAVAALTDGVVARWDAGLLHVLAPPGVAAIELGLTTPASDVWGVVHPALAGRASLTAGSAARASFRAPPLPGTWRDHVRPEAEVVWDDAATWRLPRWGGLDLLSSAERGVAALQRAVAAAAFPEPGLPMRLRGALDGRALLAAAEGALAERAVIDPALPLGAPDGGAATFAGPLSAAGPRLRPLHRARATGALSPFEAAAVLGLYAGQARARGTWALVAPPQDPLSALPGGSPDGPTLAGYDEALVVIAHEGELLLLDPTCAVCAPFEIRPTLRGRPARSPSGLDVVPEAPALDLHDSGRALEAIPSRPGQGAWRAEVGPSGILWELAGDEALEFRLWLADVAPSDRRAAIAALLAPQAPLPAEIQVDGVNVAGARITLIHPMPAPGADALLDPLALPVEGFSTLRTWSRPAPIGPLHEGDGQGRLACDGPGWRYVAWREDDGSDISRWTEQVAVTAPVEGTPWASCRAHATRTGTASADDAERLEAP